MTSKKPSTKKTKPATKKAPVTAKKSKITDTKAPKKTNKLKQLWGKLKLWQKIILTPIIIIAGVYGISVLSDYLWVPTKDPQYGVSFSIKYSEELGNNWQENYEATLKDLKFKRLRLMTYWDMYEKEQGVYDFSSLDWQMDKAAEYDAKVSLALGLRQPRWPECHQPAWADNLKYESREWQDALNNYITVVQNRYKDHPALESYQLENEAKNSWFGDCPGAAASTERLIEEFNLAKKNDPNHPVYMSLSDQHGFPAGQPVPDKYGFSVYRIVWNDKSPIEFYVLYPTPIWYHKARAAAIKLIKDRDVFIHELQVEPWGPVATKDLTVEEQDESMSTEQMEKNFLFARKLDKSGIYMWGSEWWYWRKTTLNDDRPWERVKLELERFPN